MACRYKYIGEQHYRRLVDAMIKNGSLPAEDAGHDYLYLMELPEITGPAAPYLCLTCDERFKNAETAWFTGMAAALNNEEART